ncbi:MAG: nicotinate-nucleotide adenylyltransferase [Actinomycetota bacterium]|nr:nicotinate-nucleotide adenylyltransferase [Actinomycetota bacterium]
MGGTFNPPHVGHAVCAQEAYTQLGLDRVIWMPVHEPPHKHSASDPGPEHRMRLCERAIAGDDRFEVSRLEIDRLGSSFTVDTLQALHERAPDDELVFIVGGDMAHSFPRWREPERVLQLASLAVAERSDHDRASIQRELSVLTASAQRVRFFEMPRIDVSSTLIRQRVATGYPVRYLVSDAVAKYIESHGLYRGAEKELVG